jgi:catechol 2,3-dioxygenase-like lactoylglutathione lyase family enzyme
MDIRIQCLCIDTADPARIASFWESALGWRRTWEEEGQVCLEPPEGSPEDGIAPDLIFLKVPEGKTVKNRLHLDLRPADQDAEVARLQALGARQVSIGQGDVSWVDMADPDGNEFDVLQPLTQDELPPGHDALGRRIAAGARARSRADQNVPLGGDFGPPPSAAWRVPGHVRHPPGVQG